MEICEDACSVVGDFADEAGDGAVIVCVPVHDMEELLLAVREIQLPWEQGKDELVHVTPRVKQPCRGDSGDSFSKGVRWGEVQRGE